MSSKVTSADVREWYPTRYKFGNLAACGVIVRKWDISELKNYRIYTAAYGVAYAVETCRVSGMIVHALKGMSRAKFCTLLAKVANECPTIGDVPRWLIANIKVQ